MLRARGACVFNFRRNEWNRWLREGSEKRNEGKKRKTRRKREKKKSKKAGETCTQSLSGAAESALATVSPASVIRVYIVERFSISIYNTRAPRSPHVAAAVGRSLTERKMVFPGREMWRARYAHNTTHQRSDDIAKLKRRVLSGADRIAARCVTREMIVRHSKTCVTLVSARVYSHN